MSQAKYEHLIGRECVLQVEGAREARGTVSDVGEDGVLFIHEDTAAGVPLIPHDQISRLVLAETAEREKEQQGIGARTRQEGDPDPEHAAPDERPRSLPGIQQHVEARQPQPSPAGAPAVSPPERQPLVTPPGTPDRPPLREGEIPAVPPAPGKDVDPRQRRGRG